VAYSFELAILGVEAPGRQGAKTNEYLDIPRFRNATGRDASASKMLRYFLSEPYDSARRFFDCAMMSTSWLTLEAGLAQVRRSNSSGASVSFR
jgi:hypothetical protein